MITKLFLSMKNVLLYKVKMNSGDYLYHFCSIKAAINMVRYSNPDLSDSECLQRFIKINKAKIVECRCGEIGIHSS